MAERETVREDGCQRTRDMVVLAQNLRRNPVPGPGPHLDQKTINVVGLAQNHVQNHDPDPGKGGTTTNDCNNRLCPPETRWSHGQKTRGDVGLDPAQKREGKKRDHHPRVHRKLQGPVFHPPKTKNCCRTRKKRRISPEAPSKRKRLLP